MQVVTCVGANDDAVVSAALATHKRVRLEGPSCQLNAPLCIGAHQLVEMGCTVNSTVTNAPAVLLTGESPCLRGDDTGWALNAPNMAVQFGTPSAACLRPTLKGNINSGGTAISLANGGYGQIDVGLGCSNPSNPSAYAMLIYAWDTMHIHRMLAEEYYHGIRLNGGLIGGAPKAAWDIYFDTLILDRLNQENGFALWVEPSNAQGAGLMQIGNLWAQKGKHPVFMNDANGPVRPVQIANAMWLGFKNAAHWCVGMTASSLQIGREKFV